MNTFWLIIFMLSMLGGVVAVVLVILSFVLSKMRKKRKKYGLFLGGMVVLFFVSTFAYEATLSDEERAEMERRQSEQEEMVKTEITEHTEKTDVEQEQQDENESVDMGIKSGGISEIDEGEKEEKVNEDFSLVTAEGHPAYYGSTKEAHSIWGKAEKGKIIFADSYDKYSDKTIIAMDGYSQGEKNEVIRGFEIYFKNFSTPMRVTLDDALKIADGYIPYEIISKWYEFNGSYCIQPVNVDDEEEVYYVVSYHLTESGSGAYYANEHAYSGSIEVIFEVNQEGNVNYFTVGFGTPRWMSSLSTNGYEKIEWNYDFCTQ